MSEWAVLRPSHNVVGVRTSTEQSKRGPDAPPNVHFPIAPCWFPGRLVPPSTRESLHRKVFRTTRPRAALREAEEGRHKEYPVDGPSTRVGVKS